MENQRKTVGLLQPGTTKGMPVLACLLLISIFSYAQKNKGENVTTIGIGDAGIGSPAVHSFNFMYDYCFQNHFSIGGTYNYADLSNFTYLKPGSLYRSNVSGRILFHIGKNNWDLYAGNSLGMSYWSGTGKIETYFLDFGPTIRKNGSTDYSLSALVGAKYLVKDWIGINVEMGLGDTYTGLIGISCKINNTKTAWPKVKDAYFSEIVPADKKNIIKIQMLSALAGPGISYERYLGNRFSAELGTSVKLFENATSNSTYSEKSDNGTSFYESDSLKKGYKLYGSLRYYLSKSKAFPKGMYIGARYEYAYQTTLVNVEENITGTNISFDYKKTVEQSSVGVFGGYQHTFAKHFCIDGMVGLQFGSAQVRALNYPDSRANEQMFISNFNSHRLPLNQINPYVFKLSFGYMF
ncbi:MAG: hypothetical protein WAQ28_21345 [Bacteroidia bacterium]